MQLTPARGPVDPVRRAETVRRVEQSAGRIATQSVARMDDELSWFRKLPADQRSWVSLVAQAGVASFVEWLRAPDDVLRLTGEVFRAAPRELARSVTLQQTVELVQKTIMVAEEQLPQLEDPNSEWLGNELLRFSREIAFAAARVYAGVAETRGNWDARLEALVIDGLVRGAESPEAPLSQLAALGWQTTGPVSAVVGSAPDGPGPQALTELHRTARQKGLDAVAAVHGTRLVVVLSGLADPLRAARDLLAHFGPGPVVAGPLAAEVSSASVVTRAALSGLRAAPGWPGAPRPVSSDSLLPERVLLGDTAARAELLETVYRPLQSSGDVLLTTVRAFLDCGGALEATARALFVHANTVRYRLRRVAELCGESPLDARGAYILQFALTLGLLDTVG
jgi:DNA-binding PucR family transcriptional regulator